MINKIIIFIKKVIHLIMGQNVNIWYAFDEKQYNDWKDANDYKNLVKAVKNFLRSAEGQALLNRENVSVVHSPYTEKGKQLPDDENIDELNDLNVVLFKENGEYKIVVHPNETATSEYMTTITVNA
jgi:hypothetical protein